MRTYIFIFLRQYSMNSPLLSNFVWPTYFHSVTKSLKTTEKYRLAKPILCLDCSESTSLVLNMTQISSRILNLQILNDLRTLSLSEWFQSTVNFQKNHFCKIRANDNDNLQRFWKLWMYSTVYLSLRPNLATCAVHKIMYNTVLKKSAKKIHIAI